MSNYKNFVFDYPARCHELLKRMNDDNMAQDREVTLLIALASAGLILPLERLAPDDSSERTKFHPSGDPERYPKWRDDLSDMLAKPFCNSPLSNGPDNFWRTGKVSAADLKDRPDSWPGFLTAKPISKDKLARSVIKILRNSLAHGNIWTTNSRIIENIVFAREISCGKHYEYIVGSPVSLRSLLIGWFHFLKEKQIPINGEIHKTAKISRIA